jgi:hypothetical protein
MKDIIKIAYNWIGPRGPIINTELPNIVSFAAVTEGAKNTTDNFWSDDVYWRIFLNNEPFVLGPVFDIKDDEESFVFPFTLMWRTSFFTYFFPSNGILEYSLTPDNIKYKVITGNGYFLLECAAEAWVRPEHLQLIHGYFSYYNIPMNKIIYLTGCMNAQDVYNKWCNQKNIPDAPENRMNLISYPSARYALASHMGNYVEPEYNTEYVPEKLFLCWNRRFRPHRSILIVALDKLGLVDRSYCSMSKFDPEFNSQEFKNSFHHLDFSNNVFGITTEHLNNLENKLPLIIDGETEIGEMCADKTGNARTYYQNSLVSIVTETNWELPELTSTEKSFKPFRDKHPFIIVGVNGALKSMRELGFKTFSEFWDESYDEIEDCYLRLAKIIEVCDYIGTWDNEKILDFKRRVKPIVEHNYQALKNSSTSEIAKQVEQIVKKRKT